MMRRTRSSLRVAAIAFAGAAAIVAAARWSPREPARTSTPPSGRAAVAARGSHSVAETATPDAAPGPPAATPTADVARATPRPPSTPKPAAAVSPTPVAAPPLVPLDVARSALDAVGSDPDAEAVWFAAINDPAMSPHDRSNLIEDLNENGFADPDHVVPEELPLVLARLDLIEQVAPDAMDDANADAFAEAYKDLSNIVDRLAR